MNRDSFFSNSLIQSFLNDFEKNLITLHPDLIKQYKSEIELYLYAKAIELSKQNINDENIPQEVLKNAISPKSLATAILKEQTEAKKIIPPINKTIMQTYAPLAIGPFGALALPILLGSINISASLPFAMAVIVGNLILLFNIKKIIWDDRMLTYFKKMILVCKTVIFPLSLVFFSISIMNKNRIDEFSIYYLLIYLLALLIYTMSLNFLLKIIVKKKLPPN